MTLTTKSDWVVKVINNGVHEPIIIDKPKRIPRVNGLPELRVPVKNRRKWRNNDFEDSEAEVYFEGDRVPVNVLEDVTETFRGTELVFRGGTQLRSEINEEFRNKQTHFAVNDLIDKYTSYVSDVDAPTTEEINGQTVTENTTTTDFFQKFTVTGRDPVTIENNKIKLLQSNYVTEAENTQLTGVSAGFNQGDFSNDLSVNFGEGATDQGDSLIWDFDTDYILDDYKIHLRVVYDNRPSTDTDFEGPPIEFLMNGEVLETRSFGWGQNKSTMDIQWVTLNISDKPTLFGSGTFEIRQTGDSTDSDTYVIDVISVADDRFNYFFDNTTDANFALSGPQLYPDGFNVTFDTERPFFPANQITAEVNTVNTSEPESIILEGGGQTQITTFNSSVTDTYSPPVIDIDVTAELGRYGTQTDTPTNGVNGQQIDEYKVTGDLETLPYIVDTNVNENLEQVLTEFANDTDSVWTFKIDNDGTERVVWTEEGQRSSNEDVPIASYSVERTTKDRYGEVAVKGGATPVKNEVVVIDTGNPVNLINENIIDARETVQNVDNITTYDRGADYNINYGSGSIVGLADGGLEDGQEVLVEYEYLPEGRWDNSVSGDTLIENIPSLPTKRGTKQAAYTIANAIQEPLYTVTVVVPADEVGFDVVSKVTFEQLPIDNAEQNYQLKIVESTPEQLKVELATRRTIDEIIQDIGTQVRSVARRS